MITRNLTIIIILLFCCIRSVEVCIRVESRGLGNLGLLSCHLWILQISLFLNKPHAIIYSVHDELFTTQWFTVGESLFLPAAEKQHVSPNRGAFILWKTAPVPVPQWILLAEKHPKAPLPPSQVSFSKTCHWLFGICRNSRYADNLSSHWQISVFRLGETTHLRTQVHMHTQTHTHTHLGLAVLLLLACQRPTPVNSNKSLWPAMLIATWPTKEIDFPEDSHIAHTRSTLEDTFKFKLLTQAFLPLYVFPAFYIYMFSIVIAFKSGVSNSFHITDHIQSR